MELSEESLDEILSLLEGFEVSAIVEQGIYDELKPASERFAEGDRTERTMRLMRVALEAHGTAKRSAKSAKALREVVRGVQVPSKL